MRRYLLNRTNDLNLTGSEKIKQSFSEKIKVFFAYEEIAQEAKDIVKEIAANVAKYEIEEQALDALNEKSQKLYEKAVELRQLGKTKLDALTPAKTFIDSCVEELKALKPKGDEKPNLVEIRKKTNEIIKKYKALPEDAKESLKTKFPKITSAIQNEKFQKLAQGLLKQEGTALDAPIA